LEGAGGVAKKVARLQRPGVGLDEVGSLGKLFLDPVQRVSIGRSNIQKAMPRAKKFCERSLSLVDSDSMSLSASRFIVVSGTSMMW
jgi:hypothetical protein